MSIQFFLNIYENTQACYRKFCSTAFHLSIPSDSVELDARKVCGRLSKLPVKMRKGDIRRRARDMTGKDWMRTVVLGKRLRPNFRNNDMN